MIYCKARLIATKISKINIILKKYAENNHIVYLFKVVMLWITDVPAKTLVTLLSSPSSAYSFTNKILRRLDSLKENLKKNSM